MRALLCALLAGCPAETPGALRADAGPDRVVVVGEVVAFDAGDSDGAETFAWSFGAGGAVGTAAEATAEAIFPAPGRYEVTLTVSGEDGRSHADSAVVIAHHPPASPSPRASAAIAALADGGIALVAPDLDAVLVYDGVSGALRAASTPCEAPRGLAADGAELWVACAGDDRIMRLAAGDLAVLDDLALPRGSRPFGVLRPPGGTVYVTAQGTGALYALDAGSDGWSRRTAAEEADLRGLAWSGGVVYATRHRSPDAGGVLLVLPEEGAAMRAEILPDPGPDSDTNARGVPSYLQRLTVRPDGRELALYGLKANIGRGPQRDGEIPTHETTVRADLRLWTLDGALAERARWAFDDRDLISAAAYNPTGDVLYVVTQGAETLEAYDAVSGDLLGGIPGVGHAPDGIAVAPDGRVFVLASNSREIAAFDVVSRGTLAEVWRASLPDAVPEALPPEVLRGKQIFYRSADPRMTRDGYVSCASCHLDGDHDGRTWDFTARGEGIRNTTSLLGGAGEGPLHWSANFDEVQDFEHDIRGPQAGAGFLSAADWAAQTGPLGPEKAGLDADLDALAAYVAHLDAGHRSPHPWSNEAAAGEALFGELGCDSCHRGERFSDSGWEAPGVPRLHDVGTLSAASGSRLGGPLTGLDTPTLRGLFASAPYLHDGSAPDLRAVLVARNPDDRHGPTSTLTEAELSALEAYLLTLE